MVEEDENEGESTRVRNWLGLIYLDDRYADSVDVISLQTIKKQEEMLFVRGQFKS